MGQTANRELGLIDPNSHSPPPLPSQTTLDHEDSDGTKPSSHCRDDGLVCYYDNGPPTETSNFRKGYPSIGFCDPQLRDIEQMRFRVTDSGFYSRRGNIIVNLSSKSGAYGCRARMLGVASGSGHGVLVFDVDRKDQILRISYGGFFGRFSLVPRSLLSITSTDLSTQSVLLCGSDVGLPPLEASDSVTGIRIFSLADCPVAEMISIGRWSRNHFVVLARKPRTEARQYDLARPDTAIAHFESASVSSVCGLTSSVSRSLLFFATGNTVRVFSLKDHLKIENVELSAQVACCHVADEKNILLMGERSGFVQVRDVRKLEDLVQKVQCGRGNSAVTQICRLSTEKAVALCGEYLTSLELGSSVFHAAETRPNWDPRYTNVISRMCVVPSEHDSGVLREETIERASFSVQYFRSVVRLRNLELRYPLILL